MSNVKISALPAATTPLTGTELVPLVQSGVTSQVAVSNIKTAPAGSNTQVQFNNASAFGAFASLTWDGTSLTATKLAGAHNGTVGATTPSTGAFTTVSASGATNLATGGVTVSTQLGTLTAPTTNALQHLFNGAAVWAGQTTAGGETDLGWNFYYNSGFKSRVSDVASRLSFNATSGRVSFWAAPSPGAADSALTFSETLRIESTGVFALGTLGAGGVVTFSNYGVGTATFNGSGVISSVSDETWKIKDGAPVDPNAMLNKLKPGYWYYNDEKKNTFGADRQLGFYAQNVNAAIGPEAAPEPETIVTKNDDGTETNVTKPWGYYDRSVLAVTVMSLQKALATIESLNARIAALEAK